MPNECGQEHTHPSQTKQSKSSTQDIIHSSCHHIVIRSQAQGSFLKHSTQTQLYAPLSWDSKRGLVAHQNLRNLMLGISVMAHPKTELIKNQPILSTHAQRTRSLNSERGKEEVKVDDTQWAVYMVVCIKLLSNRVVSSLNQLWIVTCELVALALSSGKILHPFCCFHILQYPLSQNLGVLSKQVPGNGCKMDFGCRVPLTQPAATPHWFVMLCPGFVQSIVKPEAV